MGHADLISSEQLAELKNDYPNAKFSQWFFDPLNKKGPDYERNKKRILDKIKVVDSTFLTTSPDVLKFLKNENSFYIPNPSDKSFEILDNYKKSCNVDVFFALSHGVHRGVLKSGKVDDRITFLKDLTKKHQTLSLIYMELIKFNQFGLTIILKLFQTQKWDLI